MIHGRRLLFLILSLALGLRIAAACGVHYALNEHDQPVYLIAGDADGYWQLAEKIRQGQPYALYDPPRYVQRMPGFPAVLAAGLWLGRGNPFVVRLLLAVLGTLTCGLLFVLGCQLFDETTAATGALLAAVSPTMIGFSVIILSEMLFALTMLICLIMLCGLARSMRDTVRCSLVWAALFGASTGMATLVRPSWLLVAPGCCLVLTVWARSRRIAAAQSACLLAACCLVLLPWAYRNRLVTEHWVVTTLWAGPSLYDGWNPSADGGSNMQFFERDQLMSRMSEYAVDRHYRGQAFRYAWEHPRRVAELAILKMKRFWSLWPTSAVLRRVDVRVIMTAYFVPIFLFGLYGVGLVRSRLWHLLLCAGPLLYFSAIHMVFVGSMRYRLPAEFPFLLLSAFGVRSWLASTGRMDASPVIRCPWGNGGLRHGLG